MEGIRICSDLRLRLNGGVLVESFGSLQEGMRSGCLVDCHVGGIQKVRFDRLVSASWREL